MEQGPESEPETTYELGTEFKTVLVAMGFKVNHFAVKRINLSKREVMVQMVWDTIPRQSHKIVSSWMEHVVMVNKYGNAGVCVD